MPPGSELGCQGRGGRERRIGVSVEQDPEEADARDTVDEAVMDLEDERPPPALEAFHQPRLPEGTVTVEWHGHEPPHESAERSVIARGRERGVTQVVIEVEVRVVAPDRAPQLQRNGPDALAVARDQVELGREESVEVGERRCRIREHACSRDVHVGDVILHVQELGVECAQAFHHVAPISACFVVPVDP